MMARKKLFLSTMRNFGVHVGFRVCIFWSFMRIRKSSPMTTNAHTWQDGNVYFSSKTCVYRRENEVLLADENLLKEKHFLSLEGGTQKIELSSA